MLSLGARLSVSSMRVDLLPLATLSGSATYRAETTLPPRPARAVAEEPQREAAGPLIVETETVLPGLDGATDLVTCEDGGGTVASLIVLDDL